MDILCEWMMIHGQKKYIIESSQDTRVEAIQETGEIGINKQSIVDSWNKMMEILAESGFGDTKVADSFIMPSVINIFNIF